jgi:4-amino-4-deoxy-L-arabinose transferase-like glycosyltransferase
VGTNARAEDAASKLRVLALAWLVVPVLFFSASGSKLPGYILPALPGAALLAGDGLHRYLRGAGGLAAMRLTGLLALLVFGAGVALLIFHVGEFGETLRGLSPIYVAALLLPAGLAALVALFTPRKRELAAISVVGATLLTIALVVASGMLGRMTQKETLGRPLAEAAAQGFGELPVVNLHTVERTSEFYAAGRLAYDANGEPLKLEGSGQVAEFARSKGGAALVIVHRNDEHQLFADPALESKRVAFDGRHALVYVKSREEQ